MIINRLTYHVVHPAASAARVGAHDVAQVLEEAQELGQGTARRVMLDACACVRMHDSHGRTAATTTATTALCCVSEARRCCRSCLCVVRRVVRGRGVRYVIDWCSVTNARTTVWRDLIHSFIHPRPIPPPCHTATVAGNLVTPPPPTPSKHRASLHHSTHSPPHTPKK